MEIVQLHQPDIDENRQQILPLLKLCMKESFCCPISEEFYAEKLNALEQYLREDQAYLYITKNSTQVTGFLWGCVLSTPVGRKFHILYFSVTPEYQGKGCGSLLLSKAEEQAKALGISKMELIVSEQNTKAVQFYNRKAYQRERLILTKQVQ